MDSRNLNLMLMAAVFLALVCMFGGWVGGTVIYLALGLLSMVIGILLHQHERGNGQIPSDWSAYLWDSWMVKAFVVVTWPVFLLQAGRAMVKVVKPYFAFKQKFIA